MNTMLMFTLVVAATSTEWNLIRAICKRQSNWFTRWPRPPKPVVSHHDRWQM